MPLRRTLLFLACFFTVAVWMALVPGGERLMTQDAPAEQAQTETRQTNAAPAVLCLAPTEPQRGQGLPPILPQEGARWTRDDRSAGEPLRFCSVPACDANGNVLRTGNFMRAAYHAFDLGDMAG